MSLFGAPKEMLSDQGKEFLNKIVAELSKNTGVERKVTAPYHPRTNGLTERFNSSLIMSLKKHAEDNPTDWDRWLPFICLAYRTRMHDKANTFRAYVRPRNERLRTLDMHLGGQ